MKKPEKKEKGLHPANKHQGRYDLEALVSAEPALQQYLMEGKHGEQTIRFADPEAVRTLNAALLKSYYGIENWDIPAGYLCPPIPGRADYIHYMADLLRENNEEITPRGSRIKCMDIGTGSSAIYPIIGIYEYGWSFVATETDPMAISSVMRIAEANPTLKEQLEIRPQKSHKQIFKGVLSTKEKIDLTVCNPPFHASAEEARAGSLRKVRNLGRNKTDKAILNFGGQQNELWCEGGEKRFITQMIMESKTVKNSCFWFSTLVSKESNLKSIYSALKNVGVSDTRTIDMGQGNKKSRIVAWTFYSQQQRDAWRDR
ncbi:MAG: 23S rRNA (adenine(1618)-N(6))-methyltransferase RlmF [Cyclobacteriaceae bacterium]